MRVPHDRHDRHRGRAIFSEYSFRRGTETSATARVTQQVDQAFLKQSLKTVAYAAVWIPYMLLSKRVVASGLRAYATNHQSSNVLGITAARWRRGALSSNHDRRPSAPGRASLRSPAPYGRGSGTAL